MKAVVGTLTYGREKIRYEVRFIASRRTLGIEVFPDSRVLVRAPVGYPVALIAGRVQKRAGWISRQLAEFERYGPRTPARQYVNGESHLYLGRQYRLKVLVDDTAGIKLSRGQLFVSSPGEPDPECIKALLHRWYLGHARRIYAEILNIWTQRLALAAKPRLAIRSMRTRWGSMSIAGTMTLNLNLIRAPRQCIEYVIVHELCHTRHRNHDRKFMELLSKWMPDWPVRKRQLEAALL